jgi:hypothetical protein
MQYASRSFEAVIPVAGALVPHHKPRLPFKPSPSSGVQSCVEGYKPQHRLTLGAFSPCGVSEQPNVFIVLRLSTMLAWRKR